MSVMWITIDLVATIRDRLRYALSRFPDWAMGHSQVALPITVASQ